MRFPTGSDLDHLGDKHGHKVVIGLVIVGTLVVLALMGTNRVEAKSLQLDAHSLGNAP